jgi:hypothetical protein
MASFHKSSSLYKATELRDFYLDIYVPVSISLDGSHTLKLQARYNNRPDLLAYDLYGTPNLWWVFASVNKDYLVDPIDDFVAGLTITVPSVESISKLL